jgi:hypothetical protein
VSEVGEGGRGRWTDAEQDTPGDPDSLGNVTETRAGGPFIWRRGTGVVNERERVERSGARLAEACPDGNPAEDQDDDSYEGVNPVLYALALDLSLRIWSYRAEMDLRTRKEGQFGASRGEEMETHGRSKYDLNEEKDENGESEATVRGPKMVGGETGGDVGGLSRRRTCKSVWRTE